MIQTMFFPPDGCTRVCGYVAPSDVVTTPTNEFVGIYGLSTDGV